MAYESQKVNLWYINYLRISQNASDMMANIRVLLIRNSSSHSWVINGLILRALVLSGYIVFVWHMAYAQMMLKQLKQKTKQKTGEMTACLIQIKNATFFDILDRGHQEKLFPFGLLLNTCNFSFTKLR